MADVAEIIGRLEVDLLRAARARSPLWLQDRLRNGSYVYGAGSFGRRVARLMREQGFECFGIIDRRAGNELRKLDDLPVIHPDALTPAMCRGRNFILGVFNPFNDFGEIIRAARGYGFAEILWGADLPDAFGPALNDFWLCGRQILIDNFDKIHQLCSQLSDHISVQTVDAVIRFRALDGDAPNPLPAFGTQYYPADLPGFNRAINFLDGGAFDGDTFRSLRGFGIEINEWVAFEPDAANFARLSAFGENCGSRATLLACGLSDRMHQVTFAAGQETGSRIAEGEETGVSIQCLAVDETFAGVGFDYIKLDIEGAEGAALRGMVKTVRKYNTRLAVSAYHKPQDLWEIPLQMKSILPEADLYLRHHYPNTFELVAYAIPQGR